MKNILFLFVTLLFISIAKAQVNPPVVKIGNQIWMAKNLNVSTYRDGTPIPKITNEVEWILMATGAYCYYKNDSATYAAKYGKLYNWYAVAGIFDAASLSNPALRKKLAPKGFHIPDSLEWMSLAGPLGGMIYNERIFLAAGKLKDNSSLYWNNPNIATNSTGFTALPGGNRNDEGKFKMIGDFGNWWSSSEVNDVNARFYFMKNSIDDLFWINRSKAHGFSVRCIKDLSISAEQAQVNPPSKDFSIGIEKAQVNSETVTIRTQTWLQKNLDVDHYRNGDPIPEVKDSATWANLTTGAWCYYNNDPANGKIYGKLYNWYAVNDPRGLAPKGWHIPSDAEWTTLATNLGGEAVSGGAMKEKGTIHWKKPNTGATNTSGFKGLPGGTRNYAGSFYGITYGGTWWSATEDGETSAWDRSLYCGGGNLGRSSIYKQNGLSVRCIRD